MVEVSDINYVLHTLVRSTTMPRVYGYHNNEMQVYVCMCRVMCGVCMGCGCVSVCVVHVCIYAGITV